MRVTYDPQVDVMTVRFSQGKIVESDEIRPGVIADYGTEGQLIRLEILDASTRVSDPTSIQLDVASPGRHDASL
jgi:uncharacterized protein YuzE